jgi:hypothetical protein
MESAGICPDAGASQKEERIIALPIIFNQPSGREKTNTVRCFAEPAWSPKRTGPLIVFHWAASQAGLF